MDAVVAIYGRYDRHDRSTKERDCCVDYVENIVIQHRYDGHRDLYRPVSPIARITDGAPPFFVVHGAADIVMPLAQARELVDALRTTSRQTVGYLERSGTQHAFDLIDGARTGAASTAIGLLINEIHRRRMLSTASVR